MYMLTTEVQQEVDVYVYEQLSVWLNVLHINNQSTISVYCSC